MQCNKEDYFAVKCSKIVQENAAELGFWNTAFELDWTTN